jgi:CubicO group peptidase (beta-lactamase class C family)
MRAGTDYEAALRVRVLEPLGMHDTRITLTPDLQQRLAVGHTIFGRVAKNWDLPTLAGAGALRSTAHDMLTFAAAHFDSSAAVFPALRDAVTPRRAIAQGGSDSVGLNWMTAIRPSHRIAWHNGGTGGYSSFLGIDRERKRAIVVLTNSANRLDDLGMRFMAAEAREP